MADPKVTYKVQVDKDGAVKGFQAVEQSVRQMAAQQETMMSKMGTRWTEMSSAIGLAKQALDLFGKAFDFVDAGAKANNVSKLFKSMYGDASGAIDQLRRDTMNLIDDTSLEQLAGQLKAVGLDVKDFGALAQQAYGVSITKGMEYKDVLNSITQSLAKNETRGLKTLGIVTDQAKAYSDYAKEVGKLTGALTHQEKQSANLKAATDALVASYGKIDAKSFDLTTQQMTTSWDNMVSTMQQKTANFLDNQVNKMLQAGKDFDVVWAHLTGPSDNIKQINDAYKQLNGTLEKTEIQLEKVTGQGFQADGITEAAAMQKSKLVSKLGESTWKANVKNTVLMNNQNAALQKEADALADKQAAEGLAAWEKSQAEKKAKEQEWLEALNKQRLDYMQGERDAKEEQLQWMIEFDTAALAAERNYLEAQKQAQIDAKDHELAIKDELYKRRQIEIEQWVTYAGVLDSVAGSVAGAIGAITKSKKAEVVATAAVAGVKAIYEQAEAIASFAMGNVPAGIAHQAAAIQYGVVAGAKVGTLFSGTGKGAQSAPPAPSLKQQSHSGMSLGKTGTTTSASPQFNVVFHGDVVGPSGDKKWLVDGLNKAFTQGLRISEKGVGKVGVNL